MNFADNKKQMVKYLLLSGCLLLLSVLLGVCALILTVVPYDFSLIAALLSDARIVALNTLPMLCVMVALYFITNRIWLSFSVAGIISYIIALVNRFKITFRDDPFVFEDMLLVGEATEMSERYRLFLDAGMISVAALIILIAVLCFFFVKIKTNGKFVRIIGAVSAAFVLLLSCTFLYFGNSRLYNSMWHAEFGNEWKSANQSMSRGVIYSFIRSIPDAFITPPEGYKEELARECIEKYSDAPLEENKKVNIISIMLEAYNDFSVFDGVEFNVDPYKNFHKLKEQAYSGKLYTNVFAAGTIKTERSFLTGYNDTNFHKKPTESYVRYFKRQGYRTEAMHPCYGWFYDRKNINEYLGFDSFDYYENKYGEISDDAVAVEKYQGLLSDYDFFDYIIEGYERSKDSDEPYFNFSVTYQNHGPYSSDKYIETEYVRRKAEYSEADYNTLNNYLYGINLTDKALGKLHDYVDGEKEPIVLILFGDHNPLLGDGNSVYNMLDINIDFATEDGAANYYSTPYVIYANEAAKKQLGTEMTGEGDTISPMMLMNEFFECAEINGSAYLNYLSSVKETYNVLGAVYVGKDGDYSLRKNEKNNDTIKMQEYVEYYVKSGKIH